MAETLGMLCDKLCVVKLKQYHTEDKMKLESLNAQSIQLQQEIDDYILFANTKQIDPQKLTFSSNKVYKKSGNEIDKINGNLGALISKLSEINCKLWHEVEKGYDIKNVPVEEKDKLINNLAVYNLERNMCIDMIDEKFKSIIIQG